MGAHRRVRVIHRPGKLGLGSAVLEGFAIAQTDIVGVMDGDLSHPPELLPRLFRTMNDGNFDLAVASRYVCGGGTSNFPIGRWLLSRAGCWLARPLTPVRDAMSGFFLIRRGAWTGSGHRSRDSRSAWSCSCVRSLEGSPKSATCSSGEGRARAR